VVALEASVRALLAAHVGTQEAAIAAAWARYQQTNGAYTNWSRQLRQTRPDLARDWDTAVASRVRAVMNEKR